MANFNTLSGFSPHSHITGSPWNGQSNIYWIPSTDTNTYAIGDPVGTMSDADIAGVQRVSIGVAGNLIRGVIVGIGFDPSNIGTLSKITIPAVKQHDYYVNVVDDPGVVFRIQEGGSNVYLTEADYGQNVNFATGPNNGYLSGCYLDNTAVATVDAPNLKILRLLPEGNNDFGQYAQWLVLINAHELNPPSAAGTGEPGPPGPPGAPGTSGTGYIYAASNPYHNAPGGTADDTDDLVTLITALMFANPLGGWTLVLAPAIYSVRADVLSMNAIQATTTATRHDNCTIRGWSVDTGSLGQSRFSTIKGITSGSFLFDWGGCLGCSMQFMALYGGQKNYTKALLVLGDAGTSQSAAWYFHQVQISNYNLTISAPPALPFGQGRAIFAQQIQDCWFDQCRTLRFDVRTQVPTGPAGAWFFVNKAYPSVGGANCNTIRFTGCQWEDILGSSIEIADTCNATMFHFGPGNKFERGNGPIASGLTGAYVIYVGNALNIKIEQNGFTNYAAANYSAIISIGAQPTPSATQGVAIIKDNFLTACSAFWVNGNTATQMIIVQDNVAHTGTSSTTNAVSLVAGSVLENPFTVTDFTLVGWEEGTRRFEREPVGFIPIGRFVSSAASFMRLVTTPGRPITNNALAVAVGGDPPPAGGVLVNFQRSTLFHVKNQSQNVRMTFLCRRTGDDETPGFSHDAVLSMNASNSNTTGNPFTLPFLPPLEGSKGIATIVGAAGTVTVTTLTAHGYTTGDKVFIAGTVALNSVAGTPEVITVTGPSTFTYASAVTASETLGGVRRSNLSSISGSGTVVTMTVPGANIATISNIGGANPEVQVILAADATFNNIHPLEGQLVTIAGTGSTYDGFYTIFDVINATTFTFHSAIDNGILHVGTAAATGLVIGDTIVVTGTVNYNNTVGTPFIISNVTSGSTVTMASTKTGTAETDGNWQKCVWTTTQVTLTPDMTDGFLENSQDRFRLQYGPLNLQVVEIIGVSIDPYAAMAPFWSSANKTSTAGASLTGITALSGTFIRQGLTANATDTLPLLYDIFVASASSIYTGQKIIWEYANFTQYTVTLTKDPNEGNDFEIRDINDAVMASGDTIPPMTTAQYLMRWNRAQPRNVGGTTSLVARLQRIGQYYATNLPRSVNTSDTTNGNITLSGANMVGTDFHISSTLQNRVATTATAANLVAAVPLNMRYVGMVWRWRFYNDAPHYETFSPNTNITLFDELGNSGSQILMPGTFCDYTIALTTISGSGAAVITRLTQGKNAVVNPTAAFTAHAGGAQANAVVMTGAINIVGTVASAGDSVKMTSNISPTGFPIYIFNGGANSMDLFPESTGTINNLAADTAIAVAAGTSVCITLVGSHAWRTTP